MNCVFTGTPQSLPLLLSKLDKISSYYEITQDMTSQVYYGFVQFIKSRSRSLYILSQFDQQLLWSLTTIKDRYHSIRNNQIIIKEHGIENKYIPISNKRKERDKLRQKEEHDNEKELITSMVYPTILSTLPHYPVIGTWEHKFYFSPDPPPIPLSPITKKRQKKVKDPPHPVKEYNDPYHPSGELSSLPLTSFSQQQLQLINKKKSEFKSYSSHVKAKPDYNKDSHQIQLLDYPNHLITCNDSLTCNSESEARSEHTWVIKS